jgi:integrase
MAALSYMQRRKSGTYEFRRRLPETLAGQSAPAHMREKFSELINAKTERFKRELVRSLGTKELREAKRRDHREALRAGELFEEALRSLTPNTLSSILTIEPEAIGAAVFAELLAGDEGERQQGDDRRHLHTSGDRVKWPDLVAVPPSHEIGMTPDHFHMHGLWLSELEGEYREALARRDPKIVFPETNIALKQRGIHLSKSSAEFQSVALEVLKAHVRAYEAMGRRQKGADIPTPNRIDISVERGPRLSKAFENWKAGGAAPGARKPGANTIKEAEQAVRYFKELQGDLALGDISREKARQFRDAIARVPRALPHKLRQLPLSKLMEQDLTQYEPRRAATVQKLLQILSAIVSKAEREGYLDQVQGFTNPFGKGIRYVIGRDQSGRKHFSEKDLYAIFGSAIFTTGARPVGGGGEAAYWFPLIGLLTGMRLDEIAQLRICDLQRDAKSGRWFFDIDRSGGRTTKTASSIRQVPVHRELARLGLLRYRQTLVKAGKKPEESLWPAVRSIGVRPLSSAWSKWFGRYLRETCNIKDPSKVFHSFRHTFKRMARDSGIFEEQHDALTGHAGSGSVGRSYGKGLSLRTLIEAIDMLTLPIKLTGVRPE